MGFKDAGKPRERLRRRFRDAGPRRPPRLRAARADPPRGAPPAIQATRQGDPRPVRHVREALNAPDERLREVPGLSEAAITEIKLLRAVALRLVRGEVLERPVLSSRSEVLDYCRASGLRSQGAVSHHPLNVSIDTSPLPASLASMHRDSSLAANDYPGSDDPIRPVSRVVKPPSGALDQT